jgi:hypothetical protein
VPQGPFARRWVFGILIGPLLPLLPWSSANSARAKRRKSDAR